MNPRLKIHPDGSATLSGIHVRDLKSILTAASLHHYDTEKGHKEKEAAEMARADANELGLGECIRQNWQDSQAWIVRIRNILTLCDKAFERHHYQPQHVGKRVIDLKPWEKQARLRDVREEKRFRGVVDRIISEAIAKRRSSSANPT
ncbi:hypothetical protein [Methylorubrum extorquens]|uniref:hypothetical protein n=1 Tax=Methylorubrum extorquens TaxID=408 RepID=UPI0020A19DC0|nr:hypothetical protein [Methylorubrum extorquens]MCP1539969.1 hypothetical protein [Methylorubrum extorquens]